MPDRVGFKAMHYAFFLLILIGIAGGVILGIGARLPVYSDPGAPGRLSYELENLPREQRFREWYAGLEKYETSHKRLTDLGRGLIACSLGIALALGIASTYKRLQGRSRLIFFIVLWIGLWAIKVPLTAWYYGLRARRFDYPVWGDSIAIPVMSESLAWVVGCVVTGLMAWILMYFRRFRSSLSPQRPRGFPSWCRSTFLGLWLALMLYSIAIGIWEGNEGMVIPCFGAAPLLLAMLAADPRSRGDNAPGNLPIDGAKNP